MDNKPLVNIVIPIHNRTRHTMQTLQSLVLNTPKELYTLHLVDDGSDAETMNAVIGFYNEQKDHINITYRRNDKPLSPGVSRNIVCDQITRRGTRHEFLYHSDNDVYFTNGWLDTLIKVFETVEISDNVRLLGGGCHPYLQDNSSVDVEFRASNAAIVKVTVGFKDAVSGYSQLMRWSAWDIYGPFDETMKDADKKIMGSEDWAFCQKMVQGGYRVASIRPEVVIHCGKTNTYGDAATGSEVITDHGIEGIFIG
jgi:glycosyltransferase involved in cell wall biosynthesis